MGGKKKKAAKNGNDKKKAAKGAKKPSGGKGRRGDRSKSRCQMDIFNEGAMENAYYLCHNIQDVLKTRGFPWPDAQKKKKKGGKRK